MVKNIAYRDRTQVVSRWNNELSGHLSRSKFEAPRPLNHNILMVDQLWLWKIPKKGTDKVMSDTIITCFPTRHEASSGNSDDIRDRVVPESVENHTQNANDLIDRILSSCTEIFEPNDIESLQFFSFFESAVGTAVSILRVFYTCI